MPARAARSRPVFSFFILPSSFKSPLTSVTGHVHDGLMPVLVALLRGINVSGHKIIKMEALRASFVALGFTQVKTYVQSGNVVFTAATRTGAGLAGKIEKRILEEYGFVVPVFITTPEKLAETVAHNPFLKVKDIDHLKLHVTFLSADPPPAALEKLQPLAAATEQFHLISRDIYLYCPMGYGNTKLSNHNIEQKLAVSATTRNWKTVNTLLTMAKDH